MLLLSKQTKFLLAVSVQILVILFLLIAKLSIVSSGTEVLLKIAPVDPRDPLRGDYVTFTYDISTVPSNYFKELPRNGQTVYIPLRQSGKYWEAYYGASTVKPANGLYIQGTIQSGGVDPLLSKTLSFNNSRKNLLIKYGIEEFFIKESSGIRFSFWNKESFAKVAIGKDGNSVIKKIYVDNEPWP